MNNIRICIQSLYMQCTVTVTMHGTGYLKLLCLCHPAESLHLILSERLTQQHGFTSQGLHSSTTQV